MEEAATSALREGVYYAAYLAAFSKEDFAGRRRLKGATSGKDARQETGFAKVVADSATVLRQMNIAHGAVSQRWPRLAVENSNTTAVKSFSAYNRNTDAERGNQVSRMLIKEYI